MGAYDTAVAKGATPVAALDFTASTDSVGQITCSADTTTSVQGPNIPLLNGVYVKAMGANTGYIYVAFNAGNVQTVGYELKAGEVIILQITNLNLCYFTASVGGEKVCWMKA